jgi:hypothetical protein
MPNIPRYALFLLAGLLGSQPALAMAGTRGVAPSAPLSQTYTWYDGEREHTVWINPTLVAEFDPPSAEDKSALKQALPTARALPGKGIGMRLWQLDGSTTPAGMSRSLNTAHPQGKYSPVLHDSPSAASGMRALPGNIIVYLKPTWSETEVKAWLQARGLEVVKKLEIGSNIYILKTEPGLAALELANTLHRSGEVVAAFPDWWQEAVTR